ncbi:hypothetical protein GH733_010248 [Mirounga leonina]|nr:hypothetical protein GH733_010248 [Mirounga leonina]
MDPSLPTWNDRVCAQLCPTPCACPWPPPRCPLGVPLVLDGCSCCQVCARQLGEPCDHLHVCDPSQGLVCQPRAGPGGRGAVCLCKQVCGTDGGEDDGSCKVNGRLYRDGETFQPHCRILCHCQDGGFTCVPLCTEDVRLPSWDCPHPRRVEVPGKCCPEWLCDQRGELGVQPLPAQGGGAGAGLLRSRDLSQPLGAGAGRGRGGGGASPEPGTCQSTGFPDRSWEGLAAEETRKAEVEHGLGPLLNHLWAGRGHSGVQPEPPLPTGDPAPPVPAWALSTCQGPRPMEQCLLEQAWESGGSVPALPSRQASAWALSRRQMAPPRPLGWGNDIQAPEDKNVHKSSGPPGP